MFSSRMMDPAAGSAQVFSTSKPTQFFKNEHPCSAEIWVLQQLLQRDLVSHGDTIRPAQMAYKNNWLGSIVQADLMLGMAALILWLCYLVVLIGLLKSTLMMTCFPFMSSLSIGSLLETNILAIQQRWGWDLKQQHYWPFLYLLWQSIFSKKFCPFYWVICLYKINLWNTFYILDKSPLSDLRIL